MTALDEPIQAAVAASLSRWRRVRDTLAAELDHGRPGADAKLPSEAALATRFGVNRHTVRRALQCLADEGRIRVVHGLGSFACPRPVRYRIGARTSFTENLAAAGREASREMGEVRERPASADLAARLQIARGAPLVEVRTLALADGEPLATSTNLFVAERLPGIADALRRTGGISAALRLCGAAFVVRLATRVHARLAGDDEAAALAMPRRQPVLVTRGLDGTAAGVPLQWGVSVFAASRIEIEFGMDERRGDA
ncbi:MAG: phosphonate metabolism transcriptional regulator PhnF [Pseudomonadota bacterium]